MHFAWQTDKTSNIKLWQEFITLNVLQGIMMNDLKLIAIFICSACVLLIFGWAELREEQTPIYALFWSQWLEEIEPVKLWSPLKVITAWNTFATYPIFALYCIVHKSYVQNIWVVSCCYVRKSYWLSIWIESVIGRSCDTHTISLQLPSIKIIFIIVVVTLIIIMNNNNMENMYVIILQHPHLLLSRFLS